MLWLLSLANLTAAMLVFTIQPLISKLALPFFGGSATVWSTALMVFQGGLLAGYLYAHGLSRLESVRVQALVHLGVVLLSLLTLPIVFRLLDGPYPSISLTASLVLSVGMPYLVVCTTSPLTQHWYHAWTQGRGRDPYVLYSVSNIGSLLALISYPFLIEPYLGLGQQRSIWSWSYGLLLVCLAAFMFARRAGLAQHFHGIAERSPMPLAGAVSWRQRGRWMMFAFVPSLYLMGVTLHIGIDVAAAPFIWILPLVLYLLTFVMVFARPSTGAHPAVLAAHACVVITLCIYFYFADLAFMLLLHLVGLFLAALVCHGRLVAERPREEHLTEFYIWMAAGGWLAGVVGALVAPVLFNDNWEYVAAIALACVLRPTQAPAAKRMDLLLPAVVIALVVGLMSLAPATAFWSYLAFGVFVTAAYTFRTRPIRFSLCVLPLLLVLQFQDAGVTLLQQRSFYGIYRVEQTVPASARRLTHGTTVHGSQALDPAYQVLPLEYYNPAGPLGQVMAWKRDQSRLESLGVIGLGVGTVACYALQTTAVTFYEIDPVIERIAREQFSYLERCAPQTRVIIGDGRLRLGEDDGQRFDVLVVDAFSSDAIPLHLLTVEAMDLYLRRLADDGVVLFHVSNRYVDLVPVIGQLARQYGAEARLQRYEPAQAEESRGASASDWVAVTLGHPPPGDRWTSTDYDPQRRLWTDDYSNLLEVIDWRKVLWL